MKRRTTITLGDKRKSRKPRASFRRQLVLVAICTLSISYVCWAMDTISEETREEQARIDISSIEHAVRLFRADHGRCPDELDELFVPVDDTFYIKKKVDPWGNEYKLTCPSRRDPGGVEVISQGPDGALGGGDNISSL